MGERTDDEIRHDKQVLDTAHVQNEAGRDAFAALAHTGLFAASIAFVGDVAPVTEAIWKPFLIAGWLASVIGLLALTWSFQEARRATDAMREGLYEPAQSRSSLCDRLNAVALWSFPVALVCLFAFVTANVVSADARQADTSTANAIERGRSAAAASTRANSNESFEEGHSPAAAGSVTPRAINVTGRSDAAAPCASPATAAASTTQEVRAQEQQPSGQAERASR